jgi:ubiquinone/menaquinone biosynthesis C-methylase UbiE
MQQDKIFKQLEGDNWFKRNQKDLNRKKILKNDTVLKLIRLFNIVSRKVLELGCANGYRLNYLKNKYNSRCFGIDCSKMAIKDGGSRFKGIKLFCSGLEKLNFKDASFDLIIISFVFHWIDRQILPSVISEADRVLKNKGLIIITDFFPLFPKRVKYKHLKEYKVYTYKGDYTKMFERLGCYQNIGRISGQYGTRKICVQLGYNFRLKGDLLLKDISLKKN